MGNQSDRGVVFTNRSKMPINVGLEQVGPLWWKNNLPQNETWAVSPPLGLYTISVYPASGEKSEFTQIGKYLKPIAFTAAVVLVTGLSLAGGALGASLFMFSAGLSGAVVTADAAIGVFLVIAIPSFVAQALGLGLIAGITKGAHIAFSEDLKGFSSHAWKLPGIPRRQFEICGGFNGLQEMKDADGNAVIIVTGYDPLYLVEINGDERIVYNRNRIESACLQKLLAGQGISVKETCIFDSQTREAVKQFQLQNEITATSSILSTADETFRRIFQVSRMCLGEKSKTVEALQELLVKRHEKKVWCDGTYGPKTARALFDFQNEAQLPENPNMDVLSWRALFGECTFE